MMFQALLSSDFEQPATAHGSPQPDQQHSYTHPNHTEPMQSNSTANHYQLSILPRGITIPQPSYPMAKAFGWYTFSNLLHLADALLVLTACRYIWLLYTNRAVDEHGGPTNLTPNHWQIFLLLFP